ncbi:MAG: tetratricopeptide repeat protein [Bacteroidetes bacterium]|nr:tetratricopeptide repeat protein [Bacteroidota bacterium]
MKLKFKFALICSLAIFSALAQNEENCYSRIQVLFDQKKFAEAEKDIQKCTAFESDTSLQIFYLRIQMSLGDFDTALVLARKILVLDSVNQVAINACGASHFMSESYNSARYFYNLNLSIDSSFRYAYYNLAMLNNAELKFQDALRDIGYYQQLYPEEADGYIMEGDIYYEMGLADTARILYEKTRERFPNYSVTYQAIAEWHFDREDYEQALKKIDQALLLDPLDDVNYYLKGQILFYMDDQHYKEAIKNLKISNELKEDATGYYALAVCYEYSNKSGKALENYNRAIAMENNEPLYYGEKAALLLTLRNYSEALDVINQAIARDTTDLYYYVIRARIYQGIGLNSNALDDYKKILETDSLYTDAFFYRALLYEDLKQTSAAMDDYNALLAIDPEDIDALFNRAMLRTDAGDLEGAKEDYTAVIDLNETDGDAYFNRALIYLEQNNMRKFCSDMSLAAQYNSKRAKKLVRKYC